MTSELWTSRNWDNFFCKRSKTATLFIPFPFGSFLLKLAEDTQKFPEQWPGWTSLFDVYKFIISVSPPLPTSSAPCQIIVDKRTQDGVAWALLGPAQRTKPWFAFIMHFVFCRIDTSLLLPKLENWLPNAFPLVKFWNSLLFNCNSNHYTSIWSRWKGKRQRFENFVFEKDNFLKNKVKIFSYTKIKTVGQWTG